MGKDSSILQLLFAIIIIMIFNMKIVSRIDAIFFVLFFFFYILFFASPKLLGIFLLFSCKFVVVLPPVLGFPLQLYHNFSYMQ